MLPILCLGLAFASAPAFSAEAAPALSAADVAAWAGAVRAFAAAPALDPGPLFSIAQSINALPDDPARDSLLKPLREELSQTAVALSRRADDASASPDELLRSAEKMTVLLRCLAPAMKERDVARLQNSSSRAVPRLDEERRRRLAAAVEYTAMALDDTHRAPEAVPGYASARPGREMLLPAPLSARSGAAARAVPVQPTPAPKILGERHAQWEMWWEVLRDWMSARGPPSFSAQRAALPGLRVVPSELKLVSMRAEERFGVEYWPPWEAARFAVTARDGILYDADGRLLDTRKMFKKGEHAMIVMDRLGNLYVAPRSMNRFHHSSLVAGRPVAFAGEIGVEGGRVKFLSPMSGHYQPSREYVDQMLEILRRNGIDTRAIDVRYYW